MQVQSHSLLKMLALAALMASVATACVEADVTDADAGAPRTSLEAQRAEEVEALLPGAWMWTEGSAGTVDLSIVFLGHDAVSGDVALLIEGENDDAVIPASVRLDGPSATLLVGASESWSIELLADDTLVLADPTSGRRARYQRMP